MKPVDFKTDNYFTGHIKFLGILLAAAGLSVATTSVLGSLILLFISLIIFTTHYRLRIDLEGKVYHDYLWVLGIKRGDKGTFENVEYLFIRQAKVSQKMNLRVATTTVRKEVYDGYLKFSNADKIHLVTKDDKEVLLSKLKPIGRKLGIRILDFSEQMPREIHP